MFKKYCCYCGKGLDQNNFTREHIIPKSKGGKKTFPCCFQCNQMRGSMPLSQFITEILISDYPQWKRLRMVGNIKIFMKRFPTA